MNKNFGSLLSMNKIIPSVIFIMTTFIPSVANENIMTEEVEKQQMYPDGIIRLSTVEVYPEYLDEYIRFATEVGEISLLTEPGVLTMYAVSEKDNPSIITILETYASEDAYKSHIASPHFQKYKQGTLHMVKNLKLVDQNVLNPVNKLKNYIEISK